MQTIRVEESLPASNDGLLVVGQHSFEAFCDGFFEAKTTRLLLGERHCVRVCALCGGVRCKLPRDEESLPPATMGCWWWVSTASKLSVTAFSKPEPQGCC